LGLSEYPLPTISRATILNLACHHCYREDTGLRIPMFQGRHQIRVALETSLACCYRSCCFHRCCSLLWRSVLVHFHYRCPALGSLMNCDPSGATGCGYSSTWWSAFLFLCTHETTDPTAPHTRAVITALDAVMLPVAVELIF